MGRDSGGAERVESGLSLSCFVACCGGEVERVVVVEVAVEVVVEVDLSRRVAGSDEAVERGRGRRKAGDGLAKGRNRARRLWWAARQLPGFVIIALE